MMAKNITIVFIALLLLHPSPTRAQAPQADSSLTYVAGEGIFIALGKADGAKFNISGTVQSGIQYNRLDSAGGKYNSSRLSLNLARMALSGSVFRDQVSFRLVTDFTGVTPILEGWVGFNFNDKKSHLILEQKCHIVLGRPL